MYKNESDARNEICEYGQKMYDKGFVAANDGNLSIKISENIIIITPTGISKGGMSPDSLVKMNLDGSIIESSNKPSSEVKMHIEAYKRESGIHSVLHSHPPLSTAFAVARRSLDKPILSEAITTLGIVPVAEYATPGSDDAAESITRFINSYNAVLLANHGLLTWGIDIKQAYFRMESVEQYAKIMYYLEKIGRPEEISSDKIKELINIRDMQNVSENNSNIN